MTRPISLLATLATFHMPLAFSAVLSPEAQKAFDYAKSVQGSNGQTLIDVTDPPAGVGKARLTILTDEPDVQKSNFDWRACKIQNTGDKRIAAVYMDVSTAIIPDIVFDADGTGGDDVAKTLSHDWGTTETKPIAIDKYQWKWQPARNDAGYSASAAFDVFRLGDVNNLFVDELSDSGLGSAGGYRGQLILFEEFDAGEEYEFSGDMDPNSLAGLSQGAVNLHAEWDVGGVSGAEMINSVITVLFADGSTASGTVASDGSQAGGVAVISDDLTSGPGLTVNKVGVGASGTFVDQLSVKVFAKAGDKVRVTKLSAFDPVDNQMGLASGLDITLEALVTSRLMAQYPSFPVNNAKELQNVEVTIPPGGVIDVSDYFKDNDDYAFAFTAVVVDEIGDPISIATKPIRVLQYRYNTGNLIHNGSFESYPMEPKTWTYVAAQNVGGWSSLNGEPLELWGTGLTGAEAVDGSVLLELDAASDKIDGIYQDIVTQKDRLYELTFYMRSRKSNFNTDDEAVVVEWQGKKTSHTGYRASDARTWTEIVVPLVGSGGTDRLTFRESTTAGANNGKGPLLDMISLRPIGNLLENGSFESYPMKPNTWTYVAAHNVQGWASHNGEPLELWGTGLIGVSAVDGSVLLELDAGSGKIDGIYQDIATEKHRVYELSFYMRARGRNFDQDDEAVIVEWRGQQTGQYHASGVAAWTKIVIKVEGSGGTERLTLRESASSNANNSLGPLLDMVMLTPLY